MAAHLLLVSLRETVETVEQAVEELHLPLVQWRAGDALPEACPGEHGIERVMRGVHRAPKVIEKPREPRRDIERAFLRAFEDLVVLASFALDLRREAVEALRALVGAREQKIAERAGDAAVAVVERVDRDEPQMREPCLENRMIVVTLVDPRDQARHLGVEPRGGRRFEVHKLTPERSGDDLHRTVRIVAETGDADA